MAEADAVPYLLFMKLTLSISEEDYSEFIRFTIERAKQKLRAEGQSNLLQGAIYGMVIGIALAIVVLFFDIPVQTVRTLALSVAILTGLIIFGFFFAFFKRLGSLQKNTLPREDGLILGNESLEFTESGVSMDKDGFKSFVNWRKVISLEESTNCFYIFVDTVAAYIIPKRSFDTDLTKEDFCAYINERIQKRVPLPNNHLEVNPETDASSKSEIDSDQSHNH